MHFTRKWHGIDELEIVVNRHIRGANELLRGRIVIIGADLHKAFIIRHREIELDEGGKQSENWRIRALGLKSLMAQLITIPPAGYAQDSINTNAETAMKHYVNANAINPADHSRALGSIVIAPNLKRGQQIEWQSRNKNLADVLTEISELTGVGWNIAVDYVNKTAVFDVALGRDLRASQSDNPPVIFAPQFESLRSIEYVESDANLRTVAYVGGAGEGAERRIVEVGEGVGWNRYETFVDARDLQEVDDDEQPIPEAQVIARLTERGRQKLAEFQAEQFLSAELLTKSPFVYEVDYDLGDMVTIRNDDWGVSMDARITEITETYSASGFEISATFGMSRPTFADRYRRDFAELQTELRK